MYQLVIVSTTKFRNDTLLAVKYVAGAVLLSQLEKFLNLVTHNESVHCGISFEIFLPVHSQTKFLFCHKFGFTCCTIASILFFWLFVVCCCFSLVKNLYSVVTFFV